MAGFDYKGQYAYHLVIATRARSSVLIGEVADEVIAILKESAARARFDLRAYCVMPDHVHVLAVGDAPGSDALRLVQRFKQVTGFRFKELVSGGLWQQSFYDHVLRREEDVPSVARYIIENPMRAGLAEAPRSFLWCGGTMFAKEGTDVGSAAEDQARASGTELKLRPYNANAMASTEDTHP
jgi:REP element-mobilizing transposase RayT